MESLLHSTTNLGSTMLHIAAQYGHTEVVRIAIDDYKLDPNARTKVCGQTCRCLAKSSRASGGLCDGRWHVADVYEHGRNEAGSLSDGNDLVKAACSMCSCHSALKSYEFVCCCDVDICLPCISLLALLVLSPAVFPEEGHDTCDASSRQRSHWCCWHASAQVQLFIDWGQQSKCIWCFVLSVTCRCEVSQVHISASFPVCPS